MNNKLLAISGMAGAPFLCLGMITEIVYPSLFNTWFTGLWGIFYISGWMCTLVSIYRQGMFNLYPFARVICCVLFGTLTIANASNMMLTLTGRTDMPLYFYFDLCWPLSNVLMFILGISIIRKRGIPVQLRRIIFITGTWFPVLFAGMMMFGRNQQLFAFSAVYSLVCWTLLGLITYRLARAQSGAFTGVAIRMA